MIAFLLFKHLSSVNRESNEAGIQGLPSRAGRGEEAQKERTKKEGGLRGC